MKTVFDLIRFPPCLPGFDVWLHDSNFGDKVTVWC